MRHGLRGEATKTLRISHPGVTGAQNAETVRFYTELLGMEIVLRQDNLDYPSEEHLFFHAGNDTFIAYFVPKDEAAATYEPARSGSGGLDHIAIDVDAGALEEARTRLTAAGIAYEGPVDRGYERSIYFKDPNNITVELLTWITPPAPGLSLAAILRRAQGLREARGAAYIEDEDVQRAMAELDAETRPDIPSLA